jgi:tetratricopeptide (TPR) repeat protein
MSKIKKNNIILLISVLAVFILAPNGHTLFKRDINKAKKLIAEGSYQKAIPLLETAVLEQITNSEAHFLLGVSYFNNNYTDDAARVFDLTVLLEPDYRDDIGQMYKEASIRSLERGEVLSACTLFEKAVEHYPMIEKGTKTVFSGEARNIEYYKKCITDTIGRSEDLSLTEIEVPIFRAHDFPDKKVNEISGNTISIKGNLEQKQVNNGIVIHGLQQLPAKESEDLHSITGVHVKQHVVSDYYMKPKMKVVFEKRFTFDDAFDKKYGQIKTIKFEKDDIRVDDQIEVVSSLKGTSIFRGSEIGIWNGDKENLKWTATKNGYYSEKVKDTQKGTFTISLAERTDIEVIVRVKRL